jgi:hypothetical protein
MRNLCFTDRSLQFFNFTHKSLGSSISLSPLFFFSLCSILSLAPFSLFLPTGGLSFSNLHPQLHLGFPPFSPPCSRRRLVEALLPRRQQAVRLQAAARARGRQAHKRSGAGLRAARRRQLAGPGTERGGPAEGHAGVPTVFLQHMRVSSEGLARE